jgi:phage gpG-like protein
MFDIRLTWDNPEKIQAVENLDKRFKKGFKEDLDKDVSIIVLRSLDQNFRDQGRPQKWEPSKRAKAQNGMTLVDTGRLRRSLSVKGDPNQFYKVGKYELSVGSKLPYAKTHDQGLTVKLWGKYPYKFPERPFIMLQEKDRENITTLINRSALGE